MAFSGNSSQLCFYLIIYLLFIYYALVYFFLYSYAQPAYMSSIIGKFIGLFEKHTEKLKEIATSPSSSAAAVPSSSVTMMIRVTLCLESILSSLLTTAPRELLSALGSTKTLSSELIAKLVAAFSLLRLYMPSSQSKIWRATANRCISCVAMAQPENFFPHVPLFSSWMQSGIDLSPKKSLASQLSNDDLLAAIQIYSDVAKSLLHTGLPDNIVQLLFDWDIFQCSRTHFDASVVAASLHLLQLVLMAPCVSTMINVESVSSSVGCPSVVAVCAKIMSLRTTAQPILELSQIHEDYQLQVDMEIAFYLQSLMVLVLPDRINDSMLRTKLQPLFQHIVPLFSTPSNTKHLSSSIYYLALDLLFSGSQLDCAKSLHLWTSFTSTQSTTHPPVPFQGNSSSMYPLPSKDIWLSSLYASLIGHSIAEFSLPSSLTFSHMQRVSKLLLLWLRSLVMIQESVPVPGHASCVCYHLSIEALLSLTFSLSTAFSHISADIRLGSLNFSICLLQQLWKYQHDNNDMVHSLSVRFSQAARARAADPDNRVRQATRRLLSYVGVFSVLPAPLSTLSMFSAALSNPSSRPSSLPFAASIFSLALLPDSLATPRSGLVLSDQSVMDEPVDEIHYSGSHAIEAYENEEQDDADNEEEETNPNANEEELEEDGNLDPHSQSLQVSSSVTLRSLLKAQKQSSDDLDSQWDRTASQSPRSGSRSRSPSPAVAISLSESTVQGSAVSKPIVASAATLPSTTSVTSSSLVSGSSQPKATKPPSSHLQKNVELSCAVLMLPLPPSFKASHCQYVLQLVSQHTPNLEPLPANNVVPMLSVHCSLHQQAYSFILSLGLDQHDFKSSNEKHFFSMAAILQRAQIDMTFALFLLVQFAAKFIIRGSLRTSFGTPQKTLDFLERLCATTKWLDKTDLFLPADFLAPAELRTISTCLNRVGASLLLHDIVQKLIYQAQSGSASMVSAIPKPTMTFFRGNAKVCNQFASMVRLKLLVASLSTQNIPALLLHSFDYLNEIYPRIEMRCAEIVSLAPIKSIVDIDSSTAVQVLAALTCTNLDAALLSGLYQFSSAQNVTGESAGGEVCVAPMISVLPWLTAQFQLALHAYDEAISSCSSYLDPLITENGGNVSISSSAAIVSVVQATLSCYAHTWDWPGLLSFFEKISTVPTTNTALCRAFSTFNDIETPEGPHLSFIKSKFVTLVALDEYLLATTTRTLESHNLEQRRRNLLSSYNLLVRSMIPHFASTFSARSSASSALLAEGIILLAQIRTLLLSTGADSAELLPLPSRSDSQSFPSPDTYWAEAASSLGSWQSDFDTPVVDTLLSPQSVSLFDLGSSLVQDSAVITNCNFESGSSHSITQFVLAQCLHSLQFLDHTHLIPTLSCIESIPSAMVAVSHNWQYLWFTLKTISAASAKSLSATSLSSGSQATAAAEMANRLLIEAAEFEFDTGSISVCRKLLGKTSQLPNAMLSHRHATLLAFCEAAGGNTQNCAWLLGLENQRLATASDSSTNWLRSFNTLEMALVSAPFSTQDSILLQQSLEQCFDNPASWYALGNWQLTQLRKIEAVSANTPISSDDIPLISVKWCNLCCMAIQSFLRLLATADTSYPRMALSRRTKSHIYSVNCVAGEGAVTIILELLHLLTQRPLKSGLIFEESHDQAISVAFNQHEDVIPSRAWVNVIPNLIAELSHPSSCVRDSLRRLLVKIGMQLPYSLTPHLSLSLRSHAINWKDIELLRDHVGGPSQHMLLNHGHPAITANLFGSAPCLLTYTECQQVFASLSSSQSKLSATHAFSRIFTLHEKFIDELNAISTLWEEEWLATIRYLQSESDLASRLQVLQEQFSAIEDTTEMVKNPTSRKELKQEAYLSLYTMVMKPVIERVRDMVNLTCDPNNVLNPHQIAFQKKYKSSLQHLLAIVSGTASTSNKLAFQDPAEEVKLESHSKVPAVHHPVALWALIDSLLTKLRMSLTRSSHLNVADVSPYLSQLLSTHPSADVLTTSKPRSSSQRQQFQLRLEGMADDSVITPGLEHHVSVQSVHSKIYIIKTKTRPKKLWINGSDGRQYAYLLKSREDVRLDQRLMRCFALVNRFLRVPASNLSLISTTLPTVSSSGSSAADSVEIGSTPSLHKTQPVFILTSSRRGLTRLFPSR
jgi:hypothetical protein